MSNTKPTIKVQDVLALLKQGYTRYSKDDAGHGNLQDHYGLTGVQIKELFNHPKLKARKTILPKEGLNIIDEDEVVETEPAEPNLPQLPGLTMENSQEVLVELGITRPEATTEEVKETINKEELFS